ncbi:MAG TPA: TetR/AcrR family transcriptional regulator [Methylotenera sp.]|nr:TetR/AcrR family transcriptional regulator [Methylotenera sp.]
MVPQLITQDLKMNHTQPKPKLGRPRSGTENERLSNLLDCALNIFMHDGYGLASMAKIASTAGFSTRTIYGLYKNKADLMVASVAHMVERDVEQIQSIAGLDAMSAEAGLCAIGEMMMARVTSPQLISLYRMGVAEAARFPEVTNKMKAIGQQRIQAVIANYLRQQIAKGELQIENVEKAAIMFCQMLVSEPRHNALMGLLAEDWDAKAHISYVVEIFLHGASKTK